MFSVIKLGAGGDMQEHVSNPKQKGSTNRKKNSIALATKNRHELETIMERVKEEDVAVMSMSNAQM